MEKRATCRSLLAAVLVLAGGCAAQRLDQFATFAEAGSAYGEAADRLARAAGEAAIEADSAVLILGRDAWDAATRRDRYLQHTGALTAYLDVLGDLRRQVRLLQSYFAALSRLARSDAPAGIAGEAEAVFKRLQQISPRLRDARIQDTPVAKLVRPAVNFAVARFQHAALERELRARAPALERSLEIQRAALALVAQGLRDDLALLARQRQFTEVAAVYAGPRKLPAKWRRTRLELLSTRLDLAAAGQAQAAAAALHAAFVALVENKVRAEDFERLFADIHALLALVEQVAGRR